MNGAKPAASCCLVTHVVFTENDRITLAEVLNALRSQMQGVQMGYAKHAVGLAALPVVSAVMPALRVSWIDEWNKHGH